MSLLFSPSAAKARWGMIMTDNIPQTDAEHVAASRPKKLRLVRLFLWSAVALLGGGLLFMMVNENGRETVEQDNYAGSVGGRFALTAPDGSIVTDQTLKGKPFAIFFGFTRCPDVCPTTLSRLTKLRKEMGEDGNKFEIVFVSVDPEYDSPEDIGRYIALFGTPIIGLTGSSKEIADTAKAYHAFYEKVPVEGGDYTIDHSAGVYLMDAEGNLQSIIDYHEKLETSLAKLKRLVG